MKIDFFLCKWWRKRFQVALSRSVSLKGKLAVEFKAKSYHEMILWVEALRSHKWIFPVDGCVFLRKSTLVGAIKEIVLWWAFLCI